MTRAPVRNRTDVSTGVKRSFVKLDRFGIYEVARQYRLESSESYLLLTMAIHAHFRAGRWIGTVTELAEDTRMSRTTVSRCLRRLVNLGLVEELEPFRPSQSGEVRVLCLDLLVTDVIASVGEELADRRHNLESLSHSPRVDLGESPARRGIREVVRWRNGEVANQEHELVEHSLSVAGRSGSAASRASQSDARCDFPGCTEFVIGHTFGDHEPVVIPHSRGVGQKEADDVGIHAAEFPEAEWSALVGWVGALPEDSPPLKALDEHGLLERNDLSHEECTEALQIFDAEDFGKHSDIPT